MNILYYIRIRNGALALSHIADAVLLSIFEFVHNACFCSVGHSTWVSTNGGVEYESQD